MSNIEPGKKYVHNSETHNLAAPNKVVPLLKELFMPKSVLDVGCGIGTWLKSFKDVGVTDIIGLDGDYVDKKMLSAYIDESLFLPTDLAYPFNLNRKFDLVISLEVAEHLPESAASGFVDSLVRHGDTIVFSAAIPNQGGQNHLNEQWKKYWINLFAQHRYNVFDLIRPKIWDMPEVDYWYKQNIIVFSKSDLSFLKMENNFIIEAVHPELFTFKLEWYLNYVEELHKQISDLINRKSL